MLIFAFVVFGFVTDRKKVSVFDSTPSFYLDVAIDVCPIVLIVWIDGSRKNLTDLLISLLPPSVYNEDYEVTCDAFLRRTFCVASFLIPFRSALGRSRLSYESMDRSL